MTVLAAASTSLFAQEDAVKEATKLAEKGQTEEAIKTLTPALSTGTAQSKATAYNLLCDINYQYFMKQQEIELENQVKKTNTPYDTIGRNNAAYNAVEAALKCDELDNQPNEKGKVKAKYRATNGKKYFLFRLNLINPGLESFNKHDFSNAAKYWGMYIDSYSSDLFSAEDKSVDKNYKQIAYYGALACYNLKDYDRAKKYASIAITDTAFVKEGNEILLFAQKESAKTKEDSLAYLAKLNEMYAANPKNERAFNLLMDYYSQPGRFAEKKAWVADLTTKDPSNKMVWALKGEIEMNEEKWDEAVASYNKSLEIDPEFVPVLYNSGVCLNNKANALKDKLADKKTGGLTPANADKVKAVLKEALTYLEKVRELDPNREKANWAYTLYQIYYSLKDDAKAAEVEKLLNNK